MKKSYESLWDLQLALCGLTRKKKIKRKENK